MSDATTSAQGTAPSAADLLDYALQLRDQLHDETDPERDSGVSWPWLAVAKVFQGAAQLGLVRVSEVPEQPISREGARVKLAEILPVLRAALPGLDRVGCDRAQPQPTGIAISPSVDHLRDTAKLIRSLLRAYQEAFPLEGDVAPHSDGYKRRAAMPRDIFKLCQLLGRCVRKQDCVAPGGWATVERGEIQRYYLCIRSKLLSIYASWGLDAIFVKDGRGTVKFEYGGGACDKVELCGGTEDFGYLTISKPFARLSNADATDLESCATGLERIASEEPAASTLNKPIAEAAFKLPPARPVCSHQIDEHFRPYEIDAITDGKKWLVCVGGNAGAERKRIRLTPKEFELLKLLLDAKNGASPAELKEITPNYSKHIGDVKRKMRRQSMDDHIQTTGDDGKGKSNGTVYMIQRSVVTGTSGTSVSTSPSSTSAPAA